MSLSKNSNQKGLCTGTYNEVSSVAWPLLRLKGPGWTITGLQMKYRYCSSRKYVNDFNGGVHIDEHGKSTSIPPPWGKDTFFRILGVVHDVDSSWDEYGEERPPAEHIVVDVNSSVDTIKKSQDVTLKFKNYKYVGTYKKIHNQCLGFICKNI